MQVVIMPYAEELWQCIRAASMHGAHIKQKKGASSCTLSLRPPNTFTNSFLRLRASLAFP